MIFGLDHTHPVIMLKQGLQATASDRPSTDENDLFKLRATWSSIIVAGKDAYWLPSDSRLCWSPLRSILPLGLRGSSAI